VSSTANSLQWSTRHVHTTRAQRMMGSLQEGLRGCGRPHWSKMVFARSILRVLDGRMMPLSMCDSAEAVCTHSAHDQGAEASCGPFKVHGFALETI